MNRFLVKGNEAVYNSNGNEIMSASERSKARIVEADLTKISHTTGRELSCSPTPVGLVKEDPIPETCSRLSSDGEDDTEEDKDDLPYRHIPYHPRPAAVSYHALYSLALISHYIWPCNSAISCCSVDLMAPSLSPHYFIAILPYLITK